MPSNFTFLDAEFGELAGLASRAESHVHPDPRAACFYARFALEYAVQWMYRNDRELRLPYDQALGALLHEPCFQQAVPEAVFHKARVIQKAGNQAVHSQRPVRQFEAIQVLKELHHVLYWLARTYGRKPPADIDPFNTLHLPQPARPAPALSTARMEEMEAQLEVRGRELADRDQKLSEVDAQLRQVQEELAAVKAANADLPDSHDYSEAETRAYLIDLDLRRAGWPLDQARDREYEVLGMPNVQGKGYVDYVLWGDDGKPLGIVEAKKATVDPLVGQQQAKLYADCLEAMTGQRPVIFYTNGYRTWIWDDAFYPQRRVAGFYGKADLERLIRRREQRANLLQTKPNGEIIERYYHRRAITSLCTSFEERQRKGLLVMATGTGKTRTAIALSDVLQRAQWAKRVLFLADRVSLVNQAANAFKKHLPDSSPVNLVTEKDKEGRVYVCTYPTMMGLINEMDGGSARFGVGYFDLIIIDEAHRSVYQKYRAIFDYFDSLLVGLTATPREQVDQNTYELFDLESGVPSDAYELEEAVKDGFLVPPRVTQVDLKFPRHGIHYDDLTETEKTEWENLDWGDDGPPPRAVNSSAINQWLFNTDTADKVLQVLMEQGHKVAGGDRLGKTIIFARNHDHAVFIEERFNKHYPHYAGHFARIIDNKAKYPQSLIDDFSIKEKAPHIAISVDMLDTGIDVPEAVNLVFFKPVYSRIKFWQMIGRGTRLCPNLFGPGEDKADFRIFDFCFNFDFFRENPDGIEGGGGESLSTRLFKARVAILSSIQAASEHDPDGGVGGRLRSHLHHEVLSMNPENFIVRMRLEAVERFQQAEVWESLSEADVHTLERELADLPTGRESEGLEARMFDLTAFQMQLSLIRGDAGKFEALRQRVVEMAGALEEKEAVPDVRACLAYLQAVQTVEFWQDITLPLLEELRLALRDLMQFIDKKKKNIVYTHFKDEIQGFRLNEPITVPRMSGAQYEKKVREYLKEHLDHLAIQKLRLNEPLTPTDLAELERLLAAVGADDGPDLLEKLLLTVEAPSLAHFVRSLVGLDRSAAQRVFASYLGDRTLSVPQMRFIEMVIDQLTARGLMTAAALYEPPFSNLHADGPEAIFSGKKNVVDGIFSALQSTQPQIQEAG